MMKVNLICVGNLKDKFYAEAAAEYEKRLQRFCTLNLIEIKEQTEKETAVCLQKEGDEICQRIKGLSVALCVEGKEKSSEDFAAFLEKVSMKHSEISFIIGSSHGLSESVKQQAQEKISFSRMTFPHGLFRVCFLEQLYRAFSIQSGSSYHK